MRPMTLLLTMPLAASPAAATVVNVEAHGFELQQETHIAASPAQVYAALTRPGQWWNGEHTFSGSAANMTLEAKAGGCWCEKLANGGTMQHMAVTYAAPGEVLMM